MSKLALCVMVKRVSALSKPEINILADLNADPRFTVAAVAENDSQPRRSLFARWIDAEGALLARYPDPLPHTRTLAKTLAESPPSPEAVFDAVVNLSGAPLRNDFHRRARLGVLTPTAFDPLAGAAEAVHRAPATAAHILHTSPAGELVLASGFYNTKFSASRNRAFLREKAAPLLKKALILLQSGGAAHELPPPAGAYGAADFARYGINLAGALLKRAARAAAARAGSRPGMWRLRIASGDALSFDPALGDDIAPSSDVFWADPFLFRRDGRLYVFFEEYPYTTRKGRICVGEIRADGAFEFIGPALETDYHLSFPYIFEHDGAIYMLPEASQARRLEIWRCDAFPDRWSLHATALEGMSPADSVLFRRRGAWWLFTNISTDPFGDHCSELYAFRTDGPSLKNLEPHRLNPIVVDARSARGAGRIFEQDGRLLRLSQNNSGGEYGAALKVGEIEELDLDVYRESLVRRIAPDFDQRLIGCHHFDADGGVCVFDLRLRNGGRG